MVSKKEALLAEKLAEVERLKAEIQNDGVQRQYNPGSHVTKTKKKGSTFKKILIGGAALFIGLPLLLSAVTEAGMTPEEKEARKIEQESQAAARKAKDDSDKRETEIASLTSKIEDSIKNKESKALIANYSKLEKIDSEKVKKFTAAYNEAQQLENEKERKRKLNFTGNFTIGNYTDEFGDLSGEKFVGYRGSGKFSNSATENSRLNFWIAMDSSSDFDISLYEYAGKNPVKDIFGGDEFVIRYRYSDITDQVTCKNHGDRIACGPTNSAKLHSAMSCLLYTSPSPRDATLSRMPSSA